MPPTPQPSPKAEARFKELTGLGFTAATRSAGDAPSTHHVVRAFDPAADETIFIPRLAGG